MGSYGTAKRRGTVVVVVVSTIRFQVSVILRAKAPAGGEKNTITLGVEQRNWCGREKNTYPWCGRKNTHLTLVWKREKYTQVWCGREKHT